MNTTYVDPKKIEKDWYLIDAQGKVLGRLASEAAKILLGKHRPEFAPHYDCGDYVVVINAREIKVTGNKMKQKMYKSYSGYPSGLKQRPLAGMLQAKPEAVLKHAVKGMLPKGALGSQIFEKLKVYPGAAHKHQAQNPKMREL